MKPAQSAKAPPAAASRRPSSAPQPARSLPELLLTQGKVSEEQLRQALATQRETGAFIGEILIEQGTIDEKSLISFLAKYCKVPHLSLLDYLIDKEILKLVPEEICLKYRLLPIDKLGSNLTVAMVNPLDTAALEKVRACCPELRIKPILCAHNHFEIVTAKLFSEKGAGGGPVELTASSFGLKIPSAKAKPASPPAAAPAPEPPQPAGGADVLEVAPEDEEFIPEAEELPAESGAQELRPEAAPETAEPQLDSDSVFKQVFQKPADSQAPAAEAPEAAALSDAGALMREMATVMMDSMRDTYAMLARRMELFRDVDPEDVAKIFARGITVEYEPGQVIFEKGQTGSELYVLLGGEVQIYDGDKELARLSRGDMFGEMALVSNEPRSASARALAPTSALALSLEVIRGAIPKDVAIQLLLNIVVTVSARLRRANEVWAPAQPPG